VRVGGKIDAAAAAASGGGRNRAAAASVGGSWSEMNSAGMKRAAGAYERQQTVSWAASAGVAGIERKKWRLGKRY